jgi:hypothetical protein
MILPTAYAAVNIATGGIGVKVALTNYDPSPAKPGNYMTLYLKAENGGGEEIKDATFKLEADYPFSFKPGENATRYFSTLGAQEPVLLEYHLFVDKNALSGDYALYLKLCLDSNCTAFSQTPFTVSVATGGTPKVEVGLEDSSTFSAGTKGTVTVHAVNRGLLDTKFLAMELLSGEQYDIISPARIYIGELKSDDIQTAEYTIYVKENAAKNLSETINLPVLVDYSDANDKEYSQTYEVPIKVYLKMDLVKLGLAKGGPSLTQDIVFIIAGIFIAYIAYRRYKKKTS